MFTHTGYLPSYSSKRSAQNDFKHVFEWYHNHNSCIHVHDVALKISRQHLSSNTITVFKNA